MNIHDAVPRFKTRDPIRSPAERLALNNQLEAARMDKMRAYNEAHPEKNFFGPKGKLAKSLNKDLQRRVNEEVAKRAPKGSTLNANVDSDCLQSLTWKDGVATATFWRGGALVYDYPMSREEFVDWVSFDPPGAGKYGNANVF